MVNNGTYFVKTSHSNLVRNDDCLEMCKHRSFTIIFFGFKYKTNRKVVVNFVIFGFIYFLLITLILIFCYIELKNFARLKSLIYIRFVGGRGMFGQIYISSNNLLKLAIL